LERTLLAGVAGRRVADEEAYVDGRLVEKVAGNRPAEYAGSAAISTDVMTDLFSVSGLGIVVIEYGSVSYRKW
jgi:hypothetical protein